MGDLALRAVGDEHARALCAGFEKHEGKQQSDGRFVRLAVGVADGDIVSRSKGDAVMFLSLFPTPGMGGPEGAGVEVGNLPPAVDEAIHLEIQACQIPCRVALVAHDIVVEPAETGPCKIAILWL